MNLNKEQIKNLLVFLGRTQIQGNEAEILVQLKILLTRELEKPEEPNKDKGQK